MDTPEPKLHSFIIKLWLEDGDETGTVVWHGYITHVPSGDRRSLRDLDNILNFVRSYIDGNRVDVRQGSLAGRWLKSWMRRKD